MFNKVETNCPRFPRVLWLALCLLLCLPLGCSRKAPDQTAFMRSTGRASVPAETLRVRIRALADSFAGRIQESADEILNSADDLEVKRHAIEWKVAAIPQVLSATAQKDPAVAILDTWAFAIQMNDFFSTGPGMAVFGQQQELALQPGTYMQEEIQVLGQTAISEVTGELYQFVHTWAKEHPISGWSFARESIIRSLSEAYEISDSLGALAQLSTLDSTLDDLAVELRMQARYIPLVARWQAELLTLGVLDAQELAEAIAALSQMATASDDVERFLQDFPGLVQGERSTVLSSLMAERQAILSALDTNLESALTALDDQHREAQRYLTSERQAILTEVDRREVTFFSDLSRERKALFDRVREERLAAFADFDRSTQALIESSSQRLEAVTDRFLDRLTRILIGVFILLGFAFVAGFLLVRRSLARRRTAS